MESVEGIVESIVYKEDEKGFTVARLSCSEHPGILITVIGLLPGIQTGETLACQGSWKNHPVYGKQLEVQEFEVKVPSTLLGIEKYLSSGMIKGIGACYAKRIVSLFGCDTLTIIDNQPHRLKEVEGLGKKRIGQIIQCWQEQRSIRNVMVFLRSYGVSPAYAQKIFRTYGTESVRKVKENPYALAQDIFGIGFKMADQIAHHLGIAKDSPYRIEAFLQFLLAQLSEEGHTCYPKIELVKKSEEILTLPDSLINAGIQTLVEKNIFFEKNDFLWLKSLYFAEQTIQKELARLINHPSAFRKINSEKAIEWVQSILNLKLAPGQSEAVLAAIDNKVHIITGGPGTGKSTITKAILRIVEKLSDRILLVAPTGRAAKRMSEITLKKAQTIHSLLEVNFASKGFKKNPSNPLDCDLIIVDEVSMIDTPLMAHFLRAIPSTSHVIFIGDINQLPSVGPGTVLKDLLNSKKISFSTLTELFRQGKHSLIAYNAKRINEGHFPYLSPEKKDFQMIECETPEEITSELIKSIENFKSLEEFQILSPMKRGLVGTDQLNQLLQATCNPSDHPFFAMGRTFHLGDKVMQVKNNYSKLVFNGDIGKITLFDREENALIIDFEGRKVIYEFSELDEISLAYAVSIHKYQGSECRYVFIPLHKSHFKLLTRNLIYTAITRGKERVVLIGSTQALWMAIQNEEVEERHTGLFKF